MKGGDFLKNLTLLQDPLLGGASLLMLVLTSFNPSGSGLKGFKSCVSIDSGVF